MTSVSEVKFMILSAIVSTVTKKTTKIIKSTATQLGTPYLQLFGIIDAKYYCNRPKSVDVTAKMINQTMMWFAFWNIFNSCLLSLSVNCSYLNNYLTNCYPTLFRISTKLWATLMQISMSINQKMLYLTAKWINQTMNM